MNIFQEKIMNSDKYFVVEYYLETTKTLKEAAWALAIGQSIGNPNERSVWETEELFEKHSILVLANEQDPVLQEKSGIIKFAFPIENIDFNTDGISHLLCTIMGGQLDISYINKCHVLDIKFPEEVLKYFKGPKYGISGIRKFTNAYNKPLVGGILKPKTGVSPEVILEMTKELVEGGVNFIKEDEILSNPSFCNLEKRVKLISEYIKDKNVIYAFCINSDPLYVLDRVKKVYELGGNAIHVNFWSGMGVYKSIRDLDLPIFLHFQKSGDKILTNNKHDFHIDWKVICYLATLMGADFIHATMWGGYMSESSDEEVKQILSILQKGGTMPALSCGMHPGLVDAIKKRFGNDLLLNVGGAIHNHPMKTKAGAKAMMQAVNNHEDGLEYLEAIKKWGKIE